MIQATANPKYRTWHNSHPRTRADALYLFVMSNSLLLLVPAVILFALGFLLVLGLAMACAADDLFNSSSDRPTARAGPGVDSDSKIEGFLRAAFSVAAKFLETAIYKN